LRYPMVAPSKLGQSPHELMRRRPLEIELNDTTDVKSCCA
jgi:hypothetical protein